jgi:hypothetical protein
VAAGTELTEDFRQIPGAAALPSRLRPSSDATTVHVRDGELLVSDGPFAEIKEQKGRLRHHRVREPRRGG